MFVKVKVEVSTCFGLSPPADPRFFVPLATRSTQLSTSTSTSEMAAPAEPDLVSIFTQIRDKLDAHYDRRERLVKISRDITALSKKMIFSLHRVKGDVTSLPAGIQKEVDSREAEIRKLIEKAEVDVQGANAYRYVLFWSRG
jgi:hypothetical protein